MDMKRNPPILPYLDHILGFQLQDRVPSSFLSFGGRAGGRSIQTPCFWAFCTHPVVLVKVKVIMRFASATPKFHSNLRALIYILATTSQLPGRVFFLKVTLQDNKMMDCTVQQLYWKVLPRNLKSPQKSLVKTVLHVITNKLFARLKKKQLPVQFRRAQLISITTIIWTPMFRWYDLRTDTQKDMCL